eukprot:PhF_6_TR14106/c1_g1_i1/m.22538
MGCVNSAEPSTPLPFVAGTRRPSRKFKNDPSNHYSVQYEFKHYHLSQDTPTVFPTVIMVAGPEHLNHSNTVPLNAMSNSVCCPMGPTRAEDCCDTTTSSEEEKDPEGIFSDPEGVSQYEAVRIENIVFSNAYQYTSMKIVETSLYPTDIVVPHQVADMTMLCLSSESRTSNDNNTNNYEHTRCSVVSSSGVGHLYLTISALDRIRMWCDEVVEDSTFGSLRSSRSSS